MELPFDKYTYRARLLPSLITLLPLAFAATVWFPGQEATWKVLGLIFVSSGLATLLSHFGRDLGKRKEAELFQLWGGVPTTRMLSHRFTKFDAVTLGRYHTKLKSLLPDLQISDLADERANPSRASEVYGSCTSFLREKTRDQKAFPLVFAENINYGFRRNLYGWKPTGLIAVSLGMVSCALFVTTHLRAESSVLLFGIAGLVVSVTLGLLWLFVIKPNWVRLAADAYAERLIRSLDGF
jgi:hypothetical protein